MDGKFRGKVQKGHSNPRVKTQGYNPETLDLDVLKLWPSFKLEAELLRGGYVADYIGFRG